MSENEDQPMEDANVQEEGNSKKHRASLKWFSFSETPPYLNCRLCSSMYEDAVRLPCCKNINACRACAESHLASNAKCWGANCEKEAKVEDLVDNFYLVEKVEKRKQKEVKFKEDLKTGEILKCCVCQEICKRGVVLPCCGEAACRGCAVKKITVKRGCWLEGCEKTGVSGEDLINDELLRSAIDRFKKEGVVDEDQAAELVWNKYKKKPKKRTKKKKKTSPKDKVAKENPSIELHISGIPDGTSKEDIAEAFAQFVGQSTSEVTQQENLKTATLACKQLKVINSILEQKDSIKIGDHSVKIELSEANKCDDLRLFLTGMALDTTEEDFKDFLEKYGNVKKLKMITSNNKSNLYAFVEFEAGLSVRKLVNENSVELNGEKIMVSINSIKHQTAKSIKAAVFHPMVGFKGMFLKKDEGAILELLEQFGKIEESKFFTKELDMIPANTGKLTGKERKKIMSRGEIKYKKQNSAINAISKEQIVHEGHTIFISHVAGTGSEVFKKRLAEKLAAKLKEKKASEMLHPMIEIKGIFLKKDENAILNLLEQFGKIEESKFFTRDLDKIPANAGELTGKERKRIVSRAVMRYKKQNPAITAISKEQVIHEGHTIFISHKSGTGSEAFKTKLAEKMASKLQEKETMKKVNKAMKRDSRGMGQSDFGNMAQSNLEMMMRQKMNQMMQQSSYSSGYGAYNPKYGRASGGMDSNGGGWRNDEESGGMWSRRDGGMSQNGGGMGQNGGGMSQNGGGIDMRRPSNFNQDFTSVTGMSGAKKNKHNMFDSGMSSRMGTDFDLGSSSSMSNMRGMSGGGAGFASGYGMGGGSGQGGYGFGLNYGMGVGAGGVRRGWFSQEMNPVPRKIRKY